MEAGSAVALMAAALGGGMCGAEVLLEDGAGTIHKQEISYTRDVLALLCKS